MLVSIPKTHKNSRWQLAKIYYFYYVKLVYSNIIKWYNIVMKVNGDSMTNENKIKQFLDANRGYISTSDFLKLNISKPLIKNMLIMV